MAEKWQKTSSPPASGVMKPELRLWMNRMTRERVSSESERKRRWVARRRGSRRGRARGPACPADAGAFRSPSPPSRARDLSGRKSGSGKGRADSVDQPADPIRGERRAVALPGTRKSRCTHRTHASSTCPRCPPCGRRRRRRTRRATCRGRRHEADRATSSAIWNRDRGGAASASGPCPGRARDPSGRPRARQRARGWASGGALRHRSSFFR